MAGRNIFKLLISIFFTTMFTFAFFQNSTEAVTIKVENVHAKTLSVAVVYYEEKEGNWKTVGWYNVSPNSVRTLTFPSGNNRNVSLHSYMGEKKWGKGDVTRTVIASAFSYYQGESCPEGKNRRVVKFTNYKANDNGQVFYKPI